MKCFEQQLVATARASKEQPMDLTFDLNEVLSRVAQRGPRRVVVNAEGYATNPGRALQEYGVVPDVVFIRRDGWTLGAPWEFASVAWGLWPDQWVYTTLTETDRDPAE